MNQDISRTSWVANEMAGVSVAAGAVAAMLTLGLAAAIARLVAWNGRQRLANSARQRCQEVEQFTTEMASSLSQLAGELDLAETGMTHALRAGLQRLRARNMWFLEENYRAFVLQRRGTHPSEVNRIIGEWVVGPLRLALDTTRKVVGQRLEERRTADRKRLNECIRRAEYDLVEYASRLLSTDVSRPGEGTHPRLQDNWRRRCLTMLVVLALPVGCAPGWSAKGPALQSTVRHVAPAALLPGVHVLSARGHERAMRVQRWRQATMFSRRREVHQ